MALRKLCNHPDLVTNDYCDFRTGGKEAGEEEDEATLAGLNTMVVPAKLRKKRSHQRSYQGKNGDISGL